EDTDITAARFVQRGTDRSDLTVHHAARTEHVGPRSGLRASHLGVTGQGGIVVDVSRVVEHATVTMVGELVQTGVGRQYRGATEFGPQIAQRDVEDTVLIAAGGAASVPYRGNAEQHQPTDSGMHCIDGCAPQ